jgi:formamidopyrimidine-DNA glycosylase
MMAWQMPELPEVETIRRSLESRLIGRRIASVRIPPDTGKPVPVIKGMEEAVFRERAVGTAIEGVSRRGKYLILHLDNGQLLVVHLRMTGGLLFPEAPEDRYVRAVFTFDDGLEMRFSDLRKFGGFWLVDDISEVTPNLGPEPFDETFTVLSLAEALTGRKTPVKSVILDQKYVAGIGNIYADEACFAAGIDPRRLALTLNEDETAALHAAIRDVLLMGLDNGGASFRDYRNTGGNVGSMQKMVKVFRRQGKPCYTCGSEIVHVKIGGRSTHFCPTCQR